MTICYQGKSEATSADTVAEFLESRGGAADAVVEYKGEILVVEALASTPLEEGAELNVYRIVSGG